MKASHLIKNYDFQLTNAASSERPRLAITMGDPAGIGPEVVLKAIANSRWQQEAEITVVGDRDCLATTLTHLQAQDPTFALSGPITCLDTLSGPSLANMTPGRPTPDTGAASFHWLDTAIRETLAGQFDGIVTGPIAKSVWHAAGHRYPGQTEVCAERAEVKHFGMLFAARSPHTGWLMRALLATTHIPLHQVTVALNPDLMTRKLALLIATLRQDFGVSTPHIAIAGLNPHSGEAGKLGTEEQTWLIPWLHTMQARYPQVRLTGPVPPDTLWVSAGHAWYTDAAASPYDAYLALYHDQGLIPVKLLAFDRAVNTTIGLPFIRTSPDHGTAFDIAGQGIARSDSMEAAIALAIDLVRQRQQQKVDIG